MSPLSPYRRAEDDQDGRGRWDCVAPPEEVLQCGPDCFVMAADAGRRRGRGIYVNGRPVIGLQAVRSGDFVRITHRDGATDSYRLGPCPAEAEPGEGRRCAFTGLPISGPAIRCPGCGRLYKEAVIEETERQCPVCGTAVDTDPEPDWPEEVL